MAASALVVLHTGMSVVSGGGVSWQAPVEEGIPRDEPGGADEIEFRRYLAETGSLDALVKTLVGFCERGLPGEEPWSPPPLVEDADPPAAFADFARQALASPPAIVLPEVEAGVEPVDEQGIIDENAALKQRVAELEQSLAETVAALDARREAAPALTLRFAGMKATNVPDADPGADISDPMLAFEVGEARACTAAVPNRSDPEWEGALDLVLPAAELGRPIFPLAVRVRVLDRDFTNPSDPLAEAELVLTADEGTAELALPWLSDAASSCTATFSYELLPAA